MADRYLHTLLTPSVLAAEQRSYGRSRPMAGSVPPPDGLSAAEAAFIGSRDSAYLATISESGWPYIQHRGGPKGFLRVTGPHELLFADYGGNRQLISAGNLAANDRVSLFLMDYAARERLKILGHARVLEARDHPELVTQSEPPGGHPARVERVFVITILSFDWNCPKFITPRFTGEEVGAAIAPLQKRIAELEALLSSPP